MTQVKHYNRLPASPDSSARDAEINYLFILHIRAIFDDFALDISYGL